MIERFPLVVYSHLRWDFVYQRPQHVLSRLARGRRILFVEEPRRADSAAAWPESTEPAPGVRVIRPRTPIEASGFHASQIPTITRLVRDVLLEEGIHAHDAWLYTPLALPLARALSPRLIVHDCMDQLSAFLGAPPELLERERELFEEADLVFTGGPSLHEAKRRLHANIHCFPSSVDVAHFRRARDPVLSAAAETRLPAPRLGYYGVIDERLDLEVIAGLAAAHPEWSIVMVGPVAKIDPDQLPRFPNLHWLGPATYDELPSHLAAWDVCLLPFARNEATRYISPTKTLEYLAAEKPIVSTPIADVAGPYADIVFLADDPPAFVAACEAALAMEEEERKRRNARAAEVLARTSWDRTAAAMERRLDETAARGSRSVALRVHVSRGATNGSTNGGHPRSAEVGGRLTPRDTTAPVLVLGAGPTGLSAAYHLGEEATLVDQNATVGGWCRSIEADGFTFDHAGHIMFSNDPYVHELYRLLLGDNVHWQEREAWIYSHGVHTRYPFQGALHGLPPAVIRECLVGAIEARFGPLRPEPAPAPGTNGHACASRNGDVKDCCADGLLEASAPLVARGLAGRAGDEPKSFEEFIYRVWGAGIAKHFAVPYNRKLWAVPLTEMETSWLGGRVPLPDLGEMIDGALQPVPKPMGPNARFGYPLRGGFQALMDGFLPHLRGPLRLGTRVTRVSLAARRAHLDDGSAIAWDQLVSTCPLPELVRMLGDEAPPAVRAAAAGLRRVSVRCVHLGIGREGISDKHWIYYPGDTVFHRIFLQGNASPHCNAPGGFGLTCEITYSPHKPLPAEGNELIRLCVEDARRVGLVRDDDPVWTAREVDMPYAYVVYDHERAARVALLREWLLGHDVVLAGRYSEWEYYNSDHAFVAGREAARKVRERSQLERRTLLRAEGAMNAALELARDSKRAREG